MNHRPTALVILDGWGYSPEQTYNAIFQAHPTTFNRLLESYPHAFLKASGEAVGLPAHMPGNSEVGHGTIGAGEIIQEPLTIINNAINDGSFFENQELTKLLATCKQNNGRLHLLGLLSEGSVHSSSHHLFAVLRAAVEQKIPHVFIHLFLDGRDVAPQSAGAFLHELEAIIANYAEHNPTISISIGSLSGRFYAMDRDRNWERTESVYAMLTENKQLEQDYNTWHAHGENPSNILQRIYQEHPYTKNNKDYFSDEIMPPTLLDHHARIQDNDTLLFFNIRPDRMRQLVSFFLSSSTSVKNSPKYLTLASMVPYDDTFGIPTLYQKKAPQTTLLECLERLHKKIFTIAETEKYAHVTYFFNGGKEQKRDNETRILIDSFKSIDSYQSNPAMAAREITTAVIQSLTQDPCDFYLINYANADMVGHSGNFESTRQAIVCLDEQLTLLYKEFVEKRDGTLYITADHGNAEEMWDFENNLPKKSHTTNKVPFIMVQKKVRDRHEMLPLTQLSEIKDFILKNL